MSILKMPSLTRSYSDKYIPGISEFDLFKNRNADWTSGRFTKIFYLIFILLIWAVLHASRMLSDADCWTATNVGHGVVRMLNFFIL